MYNNYPTYQAVKPVIIKRINREIDVLFPKKMNEWDLSFSLYKIDTTNLSNDKGYITIQILHKNNSLLISSHVNYRYPFTIPNLFVYSPLSHLSSEKSLISYNKWNQIITKQILNNSSCNTFLAWIFSIILNTNFAYGWHKLPVRSSSSVFECFCCNSITSHNNWAPCLTFADITIEYLARKKFAFFCNPLQQKSIAHIFNNDKWNLPDELILYIIQQYDIPKPLKLY